MKNLLSVAIVLLVVTSASAQSFKGVFNKITNRDSGKLSTTNSAMSASSLTSSQIIAGLKEALTVGTEKSVASLSVMDGFFKNTALKILMPAEALNAEQKLRNIGLGKQVDEAILSMNRAAEDASAKAVPVFVNAIKQMSVTDALSILKGSDSAATAYLKAKTALELTNAFKPIVAQSLDKVNATKYWDGLFSAYNKISFKKVNPDLSAYVTEKALAGIFYQIALEEQKIRKNPMARTSDILKQVFGGG